MIRSSIFAHVAYNRMMLSTKTKSPSELQRQIAKYEKKLAQAKNPSQRSYAAQKLSMARRALDQTQEGLPKREPVDGSVDLDRSEYSVR